jgi:hypothetical protein
MERWIKINLTCAGIVGILIFLKFFTPLGKGDIIHGVLHLHHSSVAFYGIVLSLIGVYSARALPLKVALVVFTLWILFDVFVCLPLLINGIVVWHNGLMQICLCSP